MEGFGTIVIGKDIDIIYYMFNKIDKINYI